MSFGFIITRHVNSQQTNKYWNHNVKLIRTYYPLKKIIIIDDNSNYEFVKADFDYKNVEIIQSEYPGRGELLPFIYFLRHKWFNNAVIIHDSTFIHKRIPFEKINRPVLPFWHYPYDKEYLDNLLRIGSYLKNSSFIRQRLSGGEINILGMNTDTFNLCFGGQCYINHSFLLSLERKYNITNLVNAITCRKDRCGFERILGVLFNNEYPDLKTLPSFYGDIRTHYLSFRYNFAQYINDFNNKIIHGLMVKVWTGR
jgi:hypothetical protein